MELEQVLDWLKCCGTNGPRSIDDPFFAEGNEACRVYTRVGIVDEDDELLCHKQVKKFPCNVLNCNEEFDTLFSHDMHYNSCHRFACSECKKQFISPHLLDLHLSETHDSFFKAQAEKKPMYVCFVESCSVVSQNDGERKKHCIEVHNFPHDFKFTSKPKKSNKPKMRKKKVESMEVEGAVATQATPKPVLAFTFGQKRQTKTFDTRQPKADSNIEMKELMEHLPT